MPPDTLRKILQLTAVDMNTPGYDVYSGNGFIQADMALLTLANPSPLITGIYYDTTQMPGIDTIIISVYGNYLNDSSIIYFNDTAISTVFIDDTTISATIYPFDAIYPAIQAYNPPQPQTNGLD
jgi:hypothetical protein